MTDPSMSRLLHAASRTFAVGIDLLSEPLRTEVEAAYLVLRVSDFLEDNDSMSVEQKVSGLERWAAALEDDLGRDDGLFAELADTPDDTPDAQVARHAAMVRGAVDELSPRAASVIRLHTAQSTRGMARWAARGPDFPDEEALDDYMHEVAGRVGWLLTDLFEASIEGVARRHGEMLTLGREFGLALQTVNVIRGLHSDWERGWIFVPRTFMPHGVQDLGELLAGRSSDPALELRIIDALVDKAERHLEAARAYLIRLPRRAHRIRLFCLLPYLFAVRTLSLSRANPLVFREETKITRADVATIVGKAKWLGWSNGWIGWYGRRLADPNRSP